MLFWETLPRAESHQRRSWPRTLCIRVVKIMFSSFFINLFEQNMKRFPANWRTKKYSTPEMTTWNGKLVRHEISLLSFVGSSSLSFTHFRNIMSTRKSISINYPIVVPIIHDDRNNKHAIKCDRRSRDFTKTLQYRTSHKKFYPRQCLQIEWRYSSPP